ncbi:MAG TPA: aminoacyl-tRNA hydrolase [Roseiflexaceae bacterium]|nr:aminoacyl-tRNA hydrolase [Roseiflexaceae bacterium]
MWLMVGLGNPGEEYTQTRHNIGFQCVNAYARRYGLDWGSKRAHARIAEGHIAGQRVALAKPFTYMNNSGQSVVGLKQWYKIDAASDLLIIYDDVDLPFGTLRLRERGSAGTHNGMRSVVAQLGSQEFRRVRVGIGPIPRGWDLARFVLGRFSREEQEQVPQLCERVADALDVIVREGFVTAMNRYNAPEKKPGPEISD